MNQPPYPNYCHVTTPNGHYRVAWELLNPEDTDEDPADWCLRVERLRWFLYYQVVSRRKYISRTPHDRLLTVNYLDALKAVTDWEKQRSLRVKP